MLSNLCDEPIRALHQRPEHNERTDVLPAALEVATADDSDVGDDLMCAQCVLDIRRAEAQAAARDDVLCATDDTDTSVLVDRRDVARHVEVASECRLRLVRCLPVAGEHRRRPPAHGEVTLRAGRKLVAAGVDDHDVLARERDPDAAGSRLGSGAPTGDDAALGSAIAVVNRESPGVHEGDCDIGARDVAGRDQSAKERCPVALEDLPPLLGERAVLGGGLAENRDVEPADQVEPLVGVEHSVVDHDLSAL